MGVDVEDAEFASVGEVVGGWVDANGTAEGAESGFERWNPSDHVVDRLATGEA